MRSWPIIFTLALAIVVGWLMNIIAWPWHLILQWSCGLSALAVVGVTLNALHREKSAHPYAGDDSIIMFIAIVAVLILTLSSIVNFFVFVVL
jgi:hypothetical protein